MAQPVYFLPPILYSRDLSIFNYILCQRQQIGARDADLTLQLLIQTPNKIVSPSPTITATHTAYLCPVLLVLPSPSPLVPPTLFRFLPALSLCWLWHTFIPRSPPAHVIVVLHFITGLSLPLSSHVSCLIFNCKAFLHSLSSVVHIKTQVMPRVKGQ